MSKQVVVFYYKHIHDERALQLRNDEAIPTPGDLEVYYAKVWEGVVDDGYAPDDMFGWFNDILGLPNPLGTSEGQDNLRKLDVAHTSMSIGDIVVMDKKAYVCSGGFDWNEIPWG